jgi:hypothetical protein
MKRTILPLLLAGFLGCASQPPPQDQTEPVAKAPRSNTSVEEITIIVAGAD